MFRALAILLATLSSIALAETAPAAPCPNLPNNDFGRLSRPQSNSAAAASFGEDPAAESELLRAVNRSRELAGIPPLRSEESLRQAARAHAQRMVESRQLEHQLPGEPALMQRIAQVSDLRMDRVGENIALAACPASANAVLMRSPPHRENLLDGRFNAAGIAAIWSRGHLYVVQDFAREVRSYSAQQSAALVAQAIQQTRMDAGLSQLARVTPPKLDAAACSLASQRQLNARLLATALATENDDRKVVAYTQSDPGALPQSAMRLLRDPGIREFAVGSCYARNETYPTGMYWIAVLLH